jgi:hypothetical protein
MPLIVLDGPAARNSTHMGDLKGPVNNPPYKSLAKKVEMMTYLHEARQWAHAHSKTGQAILSVLDKSDTNIYVVGMKGGGYSCFNSDYPKQGEGTVYMCVTLKLWVKMEAGAPRPLGGDRTKFVDDNGNGILLNPFIAFLHELGHAKQFIEYPWLFSEPRVSASAIKNAASEMLKKQGVNLTGRQKILPVYGSSTAPGWAVRVESDNLNKHEWPMCLESGYPCRQYTEISVRY